MLERCRNVICCVIATVWPIHLSVLLIHRRGEIQLEYASDTQGA
jgi:hypothetical protein